MTTIPRRHKVILHIIALSVGTGVLAFGLLTGRMIPLLIGNVSLLIAGVLRWTIIDDETADSSIQKFQKGLHLLAPRLDHLGKEFDLRRHHLRWSIQSVRHLGLLYWLDRGAISALVFVTVWLAGLAYQGVQYAPNFVVATNALLWGARIAFRLIWLLLLFRQAGRGSALAGLRIAAEATTREEPKDIEARLDRIVRLRYEEKLESALEQANDLVSVAPDLPGAYCMRGNLYTALRKYDEAMHDFDRAIQLDNQYAQAFRCRGVAWTKLSESAKAREDLLRSIELSRGTDSIAFAALGDLHLALAEYQLAADAYTKAIDLDGNPQAFLGRAEALIEMNRTHDAISDCNAVIDSQDSAAYALRAWGRMLVGEYATALTDFRTAIDLSRGQGGNYAHYGYAWLLSTCPMEKFRNGNLARVSAARIEELGRIERWEIDRLWGAVYANQNQFDMAASHQRKAIESAPRWATQKLEYQLQKYLGDEPNRSVEENVGRVLPVLAA